MKTFLDHLDQQRALINQIDSKIADLMKLYDPKEDDYKALPDLTNGSWLEWARENWEDEDA